MTRLLHVSDIHFREGSDPFRSQVLQAFATDVHTQVADRPIDLAVVTGDIAFSGKAEEYEVALPWLCGVLVDGLLNGDRERLILLPGNHDATRVVADPWLEEPYAAISSKAETCNAFNSDKCMVRMSRDGMK